MSIHADAPSSDFMQTSEKQQPPFSFQSSPTETNGKPAAAELTKSSTNASLRASMNKPLPVDPSTSADMAAPSSTSPVNNPTSISPPMESSTTASPNFTNGSPQPMYAPPPGPPPESRPSVSSQFSAPTEQYSSPLQSQPPASPLPQQPPPAADGYQPVNHVSVNDGRHPSVASGAPLSAVPSHPHHQSTQEHPVAVAQDPMPHPAPTGISGTRRRIQDNGSLNSELLATLADTESAPTNLAQHVFSLRAHKRSRDEAQKAVNEQSEITNKAYKQHQRYRNSKGSVMQSSFVRVGYALACNGPQYREKAEENEKNYLDALAEQRRREEQLSGLQKNYSEAEQKKDELEAVALVHKSSHEQLDSLYDHVFAEPTTNEFPEQEASRSNYDDKLAVLYGAKEQWEYAKRHRSSQSDEAFEEIRLALKQASREAEDARQTLELARERIFEQIVGFGAAPPAYSNCCNRDEYQDI